ncbi:MAG: hypothetical protein FD180_65 [Planctomycetota bacterium]|nr:MAG: hypothetical protein FD180_65 [Planctomycetota bacterium]
MRLFGITALAAALALPVLADPVEIKLGVKQGDKITRIGEFGGKGKLAVKMGEQEQELDCIMGESSVIAEEVLEAKDGLPTKLKRYYSKNYNVEQIPDMGHDQSKDSTLLGKLLTLEVKDGKPVTTFEGAGEAEAKELKKEKTGLEIDSAMVPGKAVNVGDSWEADPEKAKNAFGGDEGEEISEASLACTLESLEEKYGQKCAKIQVKLTTKGTRTENGQKMKVSLSLEGPVWFGLTAGRTLGMDLEGKLKSSGDLPGGQKMKLTISIKAKAESKTGVADFSAKPEPGGGEEEGEEEEEEKEEGSGK